MENMEKPKFWFWMLLDVFLVVVVVMTVCVVMPFLVQYGRSFTPARTIVVSAEGKTTATPDLAEMSFSVMSQGESPSDLSTNNSNKMNAVLQFVSSEGIASSDIKTTGYDLEPNYQYNKDTQTNEIDGYTLTQTVTIKVRDLGKVADVLSGLTPLGVNQIGGVNFTFDNSDKFTAAARADAISKAKIKAQEMANETGAWLGPVVSVSENTVIPMRSVSYAVPSAEMSVSGEAVPEPNIQPGTQDITDDVTITYAIR